MIWDETVGSGSVVAKYNSNGGDPTSGTTATSGNNINIYKKTFQTYFDCGGNATIDSLDIIVRPLLGKR